MNNQEFATLIDKVNRARVLLGEVALSPLLSGMPAGGRKLLLEELEDVQERTETVIRIVDAHAIPHPQDIEPTAQQSEAAPDTWIVHT
jgi:hypothetical protein